ncbi:polyheme membrane-associated cytochrome C [Rhodobacteraceae bacterium CCMM004]|nr:polyheme membrane-associated cytochrome C [Rhodobacteraceae bacterium CCMM004]
MPIRSFLLTLALGAAAALAAPAVAQQAGGPSLAEITEAWLASPHADRTADAFTHWNDEEDGMVPGRCAVCHTTQGAVDYMAGPMSTPGAIDHPVPIGQNVSCAACHAKGAAELTAVLFPSGVLVDALGTGSEATCAVCHQGRAWGGTVDAAAEGMEADTVTADLSFINVHYTPAAATIMGGTAKGGYEYEGRDYKGTFTHVKDLATCTDCHSPHTLKPVPVAACASCHKEAEEYTDIRTSKVDFDGDGDVTEGIADPIATLHGRLSDAIAAYATEVAGTAIVYGNAYPYFFIDTDADGAAGEGEAIYPNRYQTWTPRLLKAAYNYQFVKKDTGAHAHNPHYALQLLHDSLADLGEAVDVDMAGLTRP